MIRHIEVAIDNFDLTCWAESMEDFEMDTKEHIEESVFEYFYDNPTELIENIKIKKIWYEED